MYTEYIRLKQMLKKNKVNELAMRLKAERGIYVYVEAV